MRFNFDKTRTVHEEVGEAVYLLTGARPLLLSRAGLESMHLSCSDYAERYFEVPSRTPRTGSHLFPGAEHHRNVVRLCDRNKRVTLVSMQGQGRG